MPQSANPADWCGSIYVGLFVKRTKEDTKRKRKERNAGLFCSSHTRTQRHSFQNRTGPRGRTVKTGNRDENRFFKPKEPDFLLIPWTPKTGVRPHEPVRTMRSNPLAIFYILFFYILYFIFYKNNLTQFYST